MISMMMKLKGHVKQIIKKYWWIALVVIVFSVPRAIDYVYFRGLKLDSPNTFLSAGDLLTYYGSIIAMVVAILGVVYTIKAEQEKYHDDVLKRVMPYIAVTNCECEFKNSFVETLFGKKEQNQSEFLEYKEFQINTYYLFISPSGQEFFDKLTREQKYIIEHATEMNSEDNPKATNFYLKEYINVGVGTAVNLTIGIRRDDELGWTASPIGLSLLPCNKLRLGIYVETINKLHPENTYVDYFIRAFYSNIYGNRYDQEWGFTVFNNGYAQEDFGQKKIT